MNKKLRYAALPLILAALGNSHSQAATLTVSGKVNANSCTITVTGSGTIALPTISTADLATDLSTAGETAFVISGSSCTAGTVSVTPYFDNTGATATGRLPTSVSGVELELRQGSTTLDLSKVAGGQSVTATNISSNAFSAQFKVRYRRNQSTAFSSTGNVSVALVYILSYA